MLSDELISTIDYKLYNYRSKFMFEDFDSKLINIIKDMSKFEGNVHNILETFLIYKEKKGLQIPPYIF